MPDIDEQPQEASQASSSLEDLANDGPPSGELPGEQMGVGRVDMPWTLWTGSATASFQLHPDC